MHIPDPQALQTFSDSKLDWAESCGFAAGRAHACAGTGDALAVRRRHIVLLLPTAARG